MTSALSTELATEQAIAQHADEPFLVLLTIEHDTVAAPFRFVRNRTAVVSRGQEFLASHFEIDLPGDGDEAPRARITVANVDRRIGQAMQALVTPPTCLIELVLASTPDIVERAWAQFVLDEVTWDAFAVQGTLSRITYWDEPWPYIRVTPQRFPGLFP
jgi:Domain of unknown function (DUF1833)